MALWVVLAHAIDTADVAPRLAFTSPVKRCAKTTALNVVGRLVPRALPASNISPAAVFRAIEAARPTLLIDEADTFLKTSDELRGVLNSGHSRDSANVVRVVGDNLEVRQFSTWAAIAVALIGKLPDTLEDRSIAIEMKRKKPDETVEKFRRNRLAKLADLASMAARWAADNAEALRAATPDIPSELHDRAADNWEPLLPIADIAGGDWPARARAVAVRICGGADDDTSVRVQLLKDIGELFKKHGTDQLASATIIADLGDMEHRPWPDWKAGKPISAPQMARQLKPFGISPGTIRDGHDTAKGYKLTQLEDALRRYGGFQTVTTSQTNVTAASSDFQTVTTDMSVTDRNAPKPKQSAGCDVVTDKIGGCRPLDTIQAEKPDPDDFEERAAIAEYDGELSQEEAEELARQVPTE